MEIRILVSVVFASLVSCALQASTVSSTESTKITITDSIVQTQDNRNPKDKSSSLESRKRRKQDQLQRQI